MPNTNVKRAHATHPVLQPSNATYLLTWRGKRIGHAIETLSPYNDGYRFVRTESIALGRGHAIERTLTRVDVELGPTLAPRRGTMRRESPAGTVYGHAQRDRTGRWHIRSEKRSVVHIPRDAVFVELLPLLTAHHGGTYRGPVLLTGYQFAVAQAHVTQRAGRFFVTLTHDDGVFGYEFKLDTAGRVTELISNGAIQSKRVSPATLRSTFVPPDMIALTSIPVSGTPSEQFELAGVTAPLPPALPGQHVIKRQGHWLVSVAATERTTLLPPRKASPPPSPAWLERATMALTAASADNQPSQIRALVKYTDELLTNYTGGGNATADQAVRSGKGDCTAHALVFATLAQAAGIDVRLVTGFRLEPETSSLLRHRWAIARLAPNHPTWMVVDPTYGEAPASSVLLGLAVHDVDPSHLTIADEFTFTGFDNATAQFHTSPAD